MPRLFIDISSHGFGHLAQTAPVANALRELRPDVELVVRSGLPLARLAARINGPFEHIAEASDFGFVMKDALEIDPAPSAERYRAAHADWQNRVHEEAGRLAALKPDFVLSNVSYLPLAGAAQAGLPAAAMSSLNWGDLFRHFFGQGAGMPGVNFQISGAYAARPFLLLEPGMPVAGHPDLVRVPPVAATGRPRRDVLAAFAGRPDCRFVLVAFGGVPMRLPAERWPRREDIVWLVPQAWTEALEHPACRAFESTGLSFSDLLASVDAVLTKPGYGTFVEAAACGTPVLYQRRPDWPEQAFLIDWLHRNAAARALAPDELATDAVEAALEALWRQVLPPRPHCDGAGQVAAWLASRI